MKRIPHIANATLDNIYSPLPFSNKELCPLQSLKIISLICTLLLLIFIGSNWRILVVKTLSNHAVLLLIATSFFYMTLDLLLTLNSCYFGYTQPSSSSLCSFWSWIDRTLVCTSLLLVATASVQRYVFLFNVHLLRVHRTRWIIHYIPLMICMIYPAIFYLFLIIFYPCQQSSNDDDDVYCSTPCYFQNSIFISIDCILHSVLPLVTIVSAHMILVCWIIRSMFRLNCQKIPLWKRQKRLILRILTFSLFYVITWSPSTILYVLEAFLSPTICLNQSIMKFLDYMNYICCPAQPFICLFIINEPIYFLKIKLQDFVERCSKKRRAISVLS
ncbi:unnamed protein product [Adineta ricciae]|uniref:G-protein coupled receptors family 1 profile domain-containing protein n=1 Tax=Adineta ricciae TaxID=249248 RepID=A0A814M1L4_ADIRI|nr:unnamed protein product [Adineta ricciae]CAF1073313.1 unnamed protein product [Adineta ricciae]